MTATASKKPTAVIKQSKPGTKGGVPAVKAETKAKASPPKVNKASLNAAKAPAPAKEEKFTKRDMAAQIIADWKMGTLAEGVGPEALPKEELFEHIARELGLTGDKALVNAKGHYYFICRAGEYKKFMNKDGAKAYNGGKAEKVASEVKEEVKEEGSDTKAEDVAAVEDAKAEIAEILDATIDQIQNG